MTTAVMTDALWSNTLSCANTICDILDLWFSTSHTAPTKPCDLTITYTLLIISVLNGCGLSLRIWLWLNLAPDLQL